MLNLEPRCLLSLHGFLHGGAKDAWFSGHGEDGEMVGLDLKWSFPCLMVLWLHGHRFGAADPQTSTLWRWESPSWNWVGWGSGIAELGEGEVVRYVGTVGMG